MFGTLVQHNLPDFHVWGVRITPNVEKIGKDYPPDFCCPMNH